MDERARWATAKSERRQESGDPAFVIPRSLYTALGRLGGARLVMFEMVSGKGTDYSFVLTVEVCFTQGSRGDRADHGSWRPC